jgi:hypothetical protein
MNKIIVRIAEGLGNQLFMYANAYALSKKINYNLLIDNESGYFKNKDISNYQLDNFNITAKLCGNDLMFNSNLKNFKRKLLIKRDIFRNKKKFLIESKDKFKKTKYFDTTKKIFSETLHIEGHYESEKYFSNFKNYLKKQFLFKNENVFDNNKYLDLINKNQTIVSICVRQNRFSERIQNKYDQNQKLKSDNFTKETIDYIKRAVNFVDNKLVNAKYLVWSNDFNNLRNYLPENKFIFIDNKMNKSLTDFYLLLQCKNFIVGPTSFHWWPAWLNNEEYSLILRPKDINISNNADFWPNDWIPI